LLSVREQKDKMPPKIFYIKVEDGAIGTIHAGDRLNPDDDSVIHIAIQPRLWGTKYRVVEIKYRLGNLYIRIEKEI